MPVPAESSTGPRSGIGRLRHYAKRARSSAIARGSAVNLIGLVGYSVLQLLSIPILSASFGLDGYGIWLLIFTLPSYLILADLGLTSAATNEIAARWGAGDRRGMLVAYQSTSIFTLGICATIFGGTLAFVLLTSGIDGFWSGSLGPYRPAIVALAAWAALTVFAGAPAAVLRSTGHYERGTILWDGSTCLETMVMLGTAAWSHDINMTAVSLVATRFVTGAIILLQMRLHSNLRFGTEHFVGSEVRRLLPSALGTIAIPTTTAFSLHGTVIAIGAALGPAAVALVVPARTLSRVVIQLIGLVNRATIPALAAASGRGDQGAQLRLWRWNRRLMVGLLGLAAFVFLAVGKEFVWLWSGRLIDTPWSVIVLLAASLVLNSWWYFAMWLLGATHSHTRLAPQLVLATGGGLVLSVLLIPWLGLPGGLLGAVIADIVLVFLVERGVRRRMRFLAAEA